MPPKQGRFLVGEASFCCLDAVPPSLEPSASLLPRWLRPKTPGSSRETVRPMTNAKEGKIATALASVPKAMEALAFVRSVADPANPGTTWRIRGPGTSPSLLDEIATSGRRVPFVLAAAELLEDARAAGLLRWIPAGLATVGEAGSDLLAIDAEGAGWFFWQELQDIEPMGQSFSDWVARANASTEVVPNSTKESAIFGRWRPSRSAVISEPVLSRMAEIEIGPDGLWRLHRGSGPKDCQWEVGCSDPFRVRVETHVGSMVYGVTVLNDSRLLVIGPDSATPVEYERVGGLPPTPPGKEWK